MQATTYKYAVARCWGPCDGYDLCWSDECYHDYSCNPHKPMALREIAMVTVLGSNIDYVKLPTPLKTMCDERKKTVDEAMKTWTAQ